MRKCLMLLLSIFLFSFYVHAGNVEDSMEYALEGTEAVLNNDVDKAVSLFEKAIELNPNNFIALSSLAGAYADLKKDLNKGAELFRKSIEIEDNYAMSHFGLGITYAEMGEKEEARKEFEKTIAITDKEHIKGMARKALLMLEQ